MRSQALLTAMLAAATLGLVLLFAGLAAHAVLARRRLAAWDSGWQAIGPQWTGRR